MFGYGCTHCRFYRHQTCTMSTAQDISVQSQDCTITTIIWTLLPTIPLQLFGCSHRLHHKLLGVRRCCRHYHIHYSYLNTIPNTISSYLEFIAKTITFPKLSSCALLAVQLYNYNVQIMEQIFAHNEYQNKFFFIQQMETDCTHYSLMFCGQYQC